MNQVVSAQLTKPFPPEDIKKREGTGGKYFDYVSAGDVIRRVVDATYNDYLWTVKRLEFVSDGKSGFWLCEGVLEIPEMGARSGVGTEPAKTHEGPKTAETDAFKRAARLFGVALQLYEDDVPAAAPVQRQSAPAPPAESSKTLADRVRSELAKMGIVNQAAQAQAMLRIYGSRPEKWTADVYLKILNAPGAKWREVVDGYIAATMDSLAAAGKEREHEPT